MEHISPGICPGREHIPLGIRVFQVGEHISLGICVSQIGEHISLGICVSQVGEHVSLGTREMCFPSRGKHIVRD